MQNKNVFLITGGTGVVGSCLVHHFCAKGDCVVFTARNSQNIRFLEENVNSLIGEERAFGISIDHEDPSASTEILNFLTNKNFFPVGLVNNARSIDYLKIESDGTINRENWYREFQLGVVSAYELTLALVLMDGSKLFSVVNISSMYGIVPANPNLYVNPKFESPLHYSVIKAALIHLTKELAVRLAPNNIRVNSVAYGGIEGRVSEDFKERYAKLCPLGRMLKQDEVSGPVEFLLGPNSNAITGHTLVADGGWSLW
jgi:NAD(P)-dependent dehydrogenase (short-subunit alcohol dehydrogenase family)